MRIELPYTTLVKGFTSSRSKTETAKRVLHRGEFEIPEFSEVEAPVAYRRYPAHGRKDNPSGETRWLDGRHWRIVEPSDGVFDPRNIQLDSGEHFGLYGPVFPDRRTDLDLRPSPNDGKIWHRVTEDTAETDRARFKEYVERDTAMIGGKFAFRVDEPQVGIFVYPGKKDMERRMLVRFTSGLTTTGLDRGLYQMSLKEFPEALDEIRRASPVQIARYPGTFQRSDMLIPEAFTDSMVENAATATVEFTFEIGIRRLQDFDLPSRVAFKTAFDRVMKDGKLDVDCLEAPQHLAEFRELLQSTANRKSTKEGVRYMSHCIDVLIPIATGRLRDHRTLSMSATTEPAAHRSPGR